MKSLIACLFVFLLAAPAHAQTANSDLNHFDHIIVVYLENHSFDNLYGTFPDADGIANAALTEAQTNEKGVPYKYLPAILDNTQNPPVKDPRFPLDLPNLPFIGNKYLGLGQLSGDPVHRFYQQQQQIDGGKMDRFVLAGNTGGLPMMYYDGATLPLWQYAKRYILADRFFHAAYGGSFLNHFWLVCACTPRFDNAPADLVAQLDANGNLLKDGAVTPDGYAVNTLQPASYPHPASVAADHLLPLQTMPTIGDRLSEKGVSWAWYAGGYDDAIAGHPDPLFEFHHQPFLYFANYDYGTQARADHLKDEADLVKAIDTDTLPSVVFWKPLGTNDEHPGYADILAGDRHTAQMLQHLENSASWSRSIVIITYDENGGYWDHVPPPSGDRWGPGVRVPTIIVSQYLKTGMVDHTPYDTTSILKLIEARFGLDPLGTRDAAQPLLTSRIKFTGHFIPLAPLPAPNPEAQP
jgi:phospholipase C